MDRHRVGLLGARQNHLGYAGRQLDTVFDIDAQARTIRRSGHRSRHEISGMRNGPDNPLRPYGLSMVPNRDRTRTDSKLCERTAGGRPTTCELANALWHRPPNRLAFLGPQCCVHGVDTPNGDRHRVGQHPAELVAHSDPLAVQIGHKALPSKDDVVGRSNR